MMKNLMELSNDICTLCENKQKVFSTNTEVFIEQIKCAFFIKNEHKYQQEFGAKFALCLICCQKLQISIDFKKMYEKMCDRNNALNKCKCFFCESRSTILVEIGEDTNDFNEKIKKFLNSVIVQYKCEGWSICTRCIYYLNIWWEIRTRIYSLMNISEEINESISINIPEFKRTKRNPVRFNNLALRTNSTNVSITKQKNKEIKWKRYLRKRLCHLKTAGNIIKSEKLTFLDADEFFLNKSNDKLYEQIPYVSVSTSSQIGASMLHEGIYDTILINDSDEDISSPTIQMKNCPLKKTIQNDHSSSKEKLRIKFSSFNSLTLRNKHIFTCNVCDKRFSVRCDYLLHTLKHEKFESVIVNVTKYNLPHRINIFEFEKVYQKKNKLPAKDINQLLVKWVGKHAASTFYESSNDNETNLEESTENAVINSDSVNTIDDNDPDVEKEKKTKSLVCSDTDEQGEQQNICIEEAYFNNNVINKGKITEDLNECSTLQQDEYYTEENETNSISEGNSNDDPKKLPLQNSLDNNKFEEFSSDESDTVASKDKIVSCEELLNILEGISVEDNSRMWIEVPNSNNVDRNIDKNNCSEENISMNTLRENQNIDTSENHMGETSNNEVDETPKRKRVRFAREKAIMTPDKCITLEKLSEGEDPEVKDD